MWIPLILLTTLGPLRPMKGLLIALQYHHRAAEGRLEHKQDFAQAGLAAVSGRHMRADAPAGSPMLSPAPPSGAACW